MGDTGLQTITGDGEYLFDEAHLVTYIFFYTLVPTVEVDYRSIVVPRRQLHAGWIALVSGESGVAWTDLDVTNIAATWWTYFDFESQVINNPSGFPYDDRVQYSIPPGVTAKFQAGW